MADDVGVRLANGLIEPEVEADNPIFAIIEWVRGIYHFLRPLPVIVDGTVEDHQRNIAIAKEKLAEIAVGKKRELKRLRITLATKKKVNAPLKKERDTLRLELKTLKSQPASSSLAASESV